MWLFLANITIFEIEINKIRRENRRERERGRIRNSLRINEKQIFETSFIKFNLNIIKCICL